MTVFAIAHVLYTQGILGLLNEGKNVKICTLEEAIATEEKAAAVLDSRNEIFEVLQVCVSLLLWPVHDILKYMYMYMYMYVT